MNLDIYKGGMLQKNQNRESASALYFRVFLCAEPF